MTTIPRWVAVVCRVVDADPVTRLLSALDARDVAARAVRPWQLVAALDAGDTPTVALTRLASGTPADELSALAALQDGGLVWINRPSAVAAAHDKLRALRMLSAAGVPVPPTMCLSRDDRRSLDALPGDRLVVKPARGAAGRGVTVGLTRERALRSARAYADLSAPVLVQTFRGEGIERRHFVVAGQVVASMERVAQAADARANTAYGAVARAVPPSASDDGSIAIALKATRALGLDVAGVDLVQDAQGPCVLEVNACPGLAAIEAATGHDVADALAGLVQRTIGSR